MLGQSYLSESDLFAIALGMNLSRQFLYAIYVGAKPFFLVRLYSLPFSPTIFIAVSIGIYTLHANQKHYLATNP